MEVQRKESSDRPGSTWGVLESIGFSIDGETCGRSPDELQFRFDAPARILGVHVSVDVPPTTDLVEVMAAVDKHPVYGPSLDHDVLGHASYGANLGVGGHIDETFTPPGGIELGAGSFVGVGAWICAGTVPEATVIPEIIVWYEWLEE